MAAGSRLVLEFQDSHGDTIVHTFPYISQNITTTKVKSIMDAIIANGSIFSDVPIAKVSAKLVTTTESSFSLS